MIILLIACLSAYMHRSFFCDNKASNGQRFILSFENSFLMKFFNLPFAVLHFNWTHLVVRQIWKFKCSEPNESDGGRLMRCWEFWWQLLRYEWFQIHSAMNTLSDIEGKSATMSLCSHQGENLTIAFWIFFKLSTIYTTIVIALTWNYYGLSNIIGQVSVSVYITYKLIQTVFANRK